MSGCPFCSVIAPDISAKNLKIHIEAHHNLEQRDESEYERKTISLVNQEKTFDVLLKKGTEGDRYCCTLCTKLISAGLRDIELHIIKKHFTTYEEIVEQKMEIKEEKKLNKTYCELCWMVFPDEASLHFHERDRSHKLRVGYVQGTGCDDCNRTFSDSAHYNTVSHKKKASYVLGSGCNHCRMSNAGRNHYCTGRILAQQYKTGTGCDICKVFLHSVSHETSKAHLRTVQHKQRIYQEFIAPKIRQKSARK